MISRALMILLLSGAGVLHLVRPEVFDPAIPFSSKLAINYVAGFIELILAAGLLFARTRDLAARSTALWFLLLTPVHIYICVMGIPMFGIHHPAFLWGRTVLQAGLYFWALSLQESGWIMAQRWNQVVFLHYQVDAKKLQERVPFPLDLYQGQAVVSIVPFVMSRIRFPFLFPIPGVSSLNELNLRTYVRVNGRPGVYFFTLDSNHLPAVLIARTFFALPYRWMKLRFRATPVYEFESPEFKLKARPGSIRLASEFDQWATERYALFTQRGNQTLIGVVEHPKWPLSEIKINELQETFSQLLGSDLPLGAFLGAAFCERIDVRFQKFKPVKV